MNATEVHELTWPAFPPDPTARVPLTPARFVKGVLPMVALYQLSAVLVCTPGTKMLRRAILPVALALTYRAVTVYDASLGGALPNSVNCMFGYALPTFALRMMEWAVVDKPYARSSSPPQGSLRDGMDLLNNLRGIEWPFGRYTFLPSNANASSSRGRFILSILCTLAKDGLVLVVAPLTMTMLSPSSFATPAGGPIFHPSLPPITRFLHASVITALFGVTAWHGIELSYQFAALLVFVLPPLPFLPRADPALWPPLSLSPWRATSVAHFWTACWHQWIRRPLIVLGGKPIGRVAGRAGGIIAAFAISEVLHDTGIWALGGGTVWPGFFLMMGVGVLFEESFAQLTGRVVGGWAGRVWALTWVVVWGTKLVDGWVSRGLLGEIELPPALQKWALNL